jgi:hypothetical protein
VPGRAASDAPTRDGRVRYGDRTLRLLVSAAHALPITVPSSARAFLEPLLLMASWQIVVSRIQGGDIRDRHALAGTEALRGDFLIRVLLLLVLLGLACQSTLIRFNYPRILAYFSFTVCQTWQNEELNAA